MQLYYIPPLHQQGDGPWAHAHLTDRKLSVILKEDDHSDLFSFLLGTSKHIYCPFLLIPYILCVQKPQMSLMMEAQL